MSSSSIENAADKNSRNPSQTLRLVEERLAKESSPQDALDWTKVREVILQQNEDVKQENHRRFLETSRFIYGLVFAGTAFLTGIVLFICNYDNAIYFIVAGLIPLVSRKSQN
ncbi:MAG TPA: hypothetical protein V6C95_07945 [Coleofasciculaceae cyanobacterium]